MQKVNFIDLGLIDYKECWDYQEQLFREIVDTKIANRKLTGSQQKPTKNHLLFCEHPHVYTLGKSGSGSPPPTPPVGGESQRSKNPQYPIKETLGKTVSPHLGNGKGAISSPRQGDRGRLPVRELSPSLRGGAGGGAAVDFYKINRGGDITYHGPGQIVGYPILDLENFFTDIGKYLRYLEEAIICTLAEYDVKAGRIKGATGVWIDPANTSKARKICAMGVRCSRWVTMHGFSFNVNTDLSYFDNIIPCGILDKAVTSLEREINEPVNINEVKNKLKKHLEEVFDMELIHVK